MFAISSPDEFLVLLRYADAIYNRLRSDVLCHERRLSPTILQRFIVTISFISLTAHLETRSIVAGNELNRQFAIQNCTVSHK